jgi:hypothetical protein
MTGIQQTLDGDTSLTTDETVLSAYVGTNADLFPRVLALHVDDGATVADVTYGKGTFWSNVDTSRYDLRATDIDPDKSPTGESVDCRDLPYCDSSCDVVVLDPPYAAGHLRDGSRAGQGSHQSFAESYRGDRDGSSGKYHEAVRSLYREATEEAARVLTSSGVLIAKTQDEVVANTNEFTHIQLRDDAGDVGFDLVDLFVLVRQNTPATAGVEQQRHARKNHSYFLVFQNEEAETR